MDPELRNLLISRGITGLVSGFVLVGLPLYLSELGISIENIGYVFGMAMLFYGFLSFYFGSYSESSGRLWIGMLAILGMFVGLVVFGFLPFFSLTIVLLIFVAAKILFSLCESIFKNTAKIRVVDLSEKEGLGSNFGFFLLFTSLGFGFGMLLSGFILPFLSFQSIFFVLSGSLLVSLIFFKESGDIPFRAKKEKIFRISNLTGTSRLFKAVLLLNTLLLFSVFPVDFFGLPLFQREVLGMSNAQIFTLLGIAWIVYGLFSRLGGRVYDKYGTKGFMVSLFMISITSILLVFAKNILLFSILLIIDYMFFSFLDPASWALAGFVSKEKKGMLMSFFELFGILSGAVVILFFGKLISLFRFEFIFVFRGVLHFAGIFLLIYINRLIIKSK